MVTHCPASFNSVAAGRLSQWQAIGMAAAALPQSSRDATMQIQSSSRGSTHETNTTTESRRTPDAPGSP
ncbi:TPA: hypothetical protein MNM85_004935 [Citrobacter freundii]|nr:hypothetical protein [Citrobacter freundii]HBZ9023509.1 hypothetical protein [Citrobacter freundii]HCA0567100.1 hypothetical protein [Citrobacter freundii]HCA0665096.1 hypothetical protein [Citrobacter freundii]HCA0670518.1 hypothetical protein [Citrobacter freundii]